MQSGGDGMSQGVRICPKCGKAITKLIPYPLLDGTGKIEMKEVNIMCDCEVAQQEQIEKRFRYEEQQRQISRLKQCSLMDNKLRQAKISAFVKTAENEKVFRIASKYITQFDEMLKKGQGLMFFGDVGTGKSYAAACIANDLMEKNYSVIMTSFVSLLHADKENISNYRLNQASLLILDDFGAERGTDYALENVYNIIDSRYRSGKPIIITTNIALREMQICEDIRYSRIYDRLFEMCYPVKVEGKSWRKKEAVARFDDMKKMFGE